MLKNKGSESIVVIFVVTLILSVIGLMMWGFPKYNVWNQEMSGKADLREAEWSRQITVEEAQANLESEKLNALAEIERAKGVAESNKIIGEGLKNNEEYLKYLWVKGLSKSDVIYVPTEAGLPILEASRLR